MSKFSKGLYICSWIAILISFYLKLFGCSAFDIDTSKKMQKMEKLLDTIGI